MLMYIYMNTITNVNMQMIMIMSCMSMVISYSFHFSGSRGINEKRLYRYFLGASNALQGNFYVGP